MKIKYIKANDIYYHPIETGKQDPSKIQGCFYPVCYIKKLSLGRYQIDYYDEYIDFYKNQNNQLPLSRIILYPSGIQEIRYEK